ncbi:hypothetical protein GcC1_214019 [Golovinomyces cichoracearum]|uniref:Uncharacterized protein n=1 Tax=Golovinomyces cichoracearum TaxID=62708 RepID=A0A420H9J0_9PEZI|nr:hypothetical protein GcC1_214019 [Golovinomyces cichoracearum]
MDNYSVIDDAEAKPVILLPSIPSTDEDSITLLVEVPGAKKCDMPGVRCQTCARLGNTVWVLPGKWCPICGTECDY